VPDRLGLTISKTLIELHGGRIGFHTSEGADGRSGSEFFFHLRLPVLVLREDDRSLLSAGEEGAREDVAAVHQPGRQLSPIESSETYMEHDDGGVSSHRRNNSLTSNDIPSVRFHDDEFNVAVAVYADMQHHVADGDGKDGTSELLAPHTVSAPPSPPEAVRALPFAPVADSRADGCLQDTENTVFSSLKHPRKTRKASADASRGPIPRVLVVEGVCNKHTDH
jgi:hypothetical protein